MADEQEVLDALLAALPAACRAHPTGEVPTPFPADFTTVRVVERAGGSGRGGRFATRGWTAYITGASSRSEDNARTALRLADEALSGLVLLVGAERSTPIRFDVARPIDKPSGKTHYAGDRSYHFAI